MLKCSVVPRALSSHVRHLVSLILAAAIGGCGGGGDVVGNVNVDTRVTSIRIEPATATVMASQQVTLNATALNAAGTVVVGQPFTWTSSASTIASVNASGIVTAVAPGVVTISASAAGITGHASLTVTPDTIVAGVTLSANTATLAVGGTLTLGATARNAAGEPV